MAGMTVKRDKKNARVTYQFKGNLRDALEKSEVELERKRKSKDREFLKWQYEKAKKAYEAYERRIEDLKGFIELAKEEIDKEIKKVNEEDTDHEN